MSVVETQAEADDLNRLQIYGPYIAANGHYMTAPLRFPREDACEHGESYRHDVGDEQTTSDGEPYFIQCSGPGEREFRVGDEIRYDSFAAWCDTKCDHSESGPPEDW